MRSLTRTPVSYTHLVGNGELPAVNVDLHAGDGVDQGQCIRTCCLCRFRHFRNVCHIGAQLHDDGLLCMFFQFRSNVIQGIRFLSEGNGSFLDIRAGYIDLDVYKRQLVDRNWQAVLRYFSPLLFFALGVAMAECIRMKYQKAQKIHWRQLVLAIEILLLFAVGFLPNEIDLLANAMVSFACAMQVQAFRKVNGYAFASTMCIGNLRSGMELSLIHIWSHPPFCCGRV